jgi:hypothetical protein
MKNFLVEFKIVILTLWAIRYFKIQNTVQNTKTNSNIRGNRCGSAVKLWDEKINNIRRSRVCSPARATFQKIQMFSILVEICQAIFQPKLSSVKLIPGV